MDRPSGLPGQGDERLAQEVMQAAIRALDIFRSPPVGKESSEPVTPARSLAQEAATFLEQKEFHNAFRAASQALAEARAPATASSPQRSRDEADALRALGQVHFALREPDTAVEALSEAVALSKKMVDKKVGAGSLTKLANAFLDMGRLEDSLEAADSARELYGQILDGRGQAELFRGPMAAAHWRKGEYDRALAATEAALELFRILGDRTEEMSTQYVLAKLRRDAGRLEEALDGAAELLALCARAGNAAAEADARHMAAHLHLLAGEYEEALSAASTARAMFQRLQDKSGEVAVLETTISVHLALDDLLAAQRAAEEAQAVALGAGDRPRAAKAAQAIANVRIFKQEFREVLQAAKAAREACHEQGDAHGEAQQWLAIAHARVEQVRIAALDEQPAGVSLKAMGPTRRVMEALMACKEALHLFRRLEDSQGEIAALLALAKARRLNDEPRLALAAARDCATACSSHDDARGAAQAHLEEAATHLMMVGTPWDDPSEDVRDWGGDPPARAALASAEKALDMCRGLQEKELEQHAVKVLEAIRKSLATPPYGPEELREVLLVIDAREQGPLEDMGFHFKSQAEAAELLRVDPRLEDILRKELPGLLLPGAAAPMSPDTAMERLLGVLSRQASVGTAY